MPFQCSRHPVDKRKSQVIVVMTSQLAKDLMEDLMQEETTPNDFFASSRLDEASDYSEDEAECPLMGTDLCEAGKFKGKKSYAQVYREEKSYVQWIRSHITTKSCAGMKKLRLYIECLDNAKKERLQIMWQEKKAMQKEKAGKKQMPILPKAKSKNSSKARGSQENNEEAIQEAAERILARVNHLANPRTRGREGGGWIHQFDEENGMEQEEDWNSEITSDWEAVATANAQPKTRPYKSK